MTNQSSNLEIFIKQVQNHSYSQKYLRWTSYLQSVQSSSPQTYPQVLLSFVQQFPFNYTYWISYIHHMNTLSSYQLALKKNSKSTQLWFSYLLVLKNAKCQPAKYKKQLQRAIVQIGADCRSISLYQQYYDLVADGFKYQFYKKIAAKALIGLQDMLQKFKNWLQQLSQVQINTYFTKQMKGAVSLTNQQTIQTKKVYLYDQIEKTFKKTIHYRQQRLKIEDKIQRHYFDGTNQQLQEIVYWKQLLELERRNGIIQNISYCYQRCLMAQTQNFELWSEAFHYLEHQTNKYTKVLSILRNNKTFFIQFSKQLYFYWCDMEERQSNVRARQMYKQICQLSPCLETYQRFIQFEIREKGYQAAKQLYDTMLSMYSKDHDTLSFILMQYCNFVIKHYKDYQYPKALLKNYFDYLPYNKFLLTQYLNFMQHFQNNQGYYDQLMIILCESLKKSKKILRQSQFNDFIKMIRYYLRNVLGSIYLIKLSERKIMEMVEGLHAKRDEYQVDDGHNQNLDG